LAPRPRVLPNKRQFHGLGVNRIESACQISHKAVCAGKADLGILNAEIGHALEAG
jgi:hypothetical protein